MINFSKKSRLLLIVFIIFLLLLPAAQSLADTAYRRDERILKERADRIKAELIQQHVTDRLPPGALPPIDLNEENTSLLRANIKNRIGRAKFVAAELEDELHRRQTELTSQYAAKQFDEATFNEQWRAIGAEILPLRATWLAEASKWEASLGYLDEKCFSLMRFNGPACYRNLLRSMSDLLYTVGGRLVNWTDGLLKKAIDISIYDFHKYISGDPAIANDTGLTIVTDVWRLIRDLINLTFIFVLLYAALNLILGLGNASNTKKTIVTIIIAALLINFSMIIPKVFIDLSNLATIQFHNAIGGRESNIAQNINSNLNILSRVDQEVNKDPSMGFSTNASNLANLTISVAGTFLFMLIVAFVLLTIALMLFVRAIVFIFLIMLSPIAVGAFVLPKIKPYADKWWKQLLSQAFLAPAMMFLLWASLSVAGGSTARQISGDGGDGFSMGYFVYFLIVISFLLAAIMLAKQSSAMGAGAALGMAGKLKDLTVGVAKGGAMMGAGFAGAHTLGRLANNLKSRPGFNRFVASNPTLGRTLYGGLDKASAGFNKRVDAKAEARASVVGMVSRDQQINAVANLTGKAQVKAFNKLSDRQKMDFASHPEHGTQYQAIKKKLKDEELEKLHKTEVGRVKTLTGNDRRDFFNKTLTADQQAEAYRNLSPRDRVALEQSLAAEGVGWERNDHLSVDEIEKTEKEQKIVERREETTRILDILKNPATDAATAGTLIQNLSGDRTDKILDLTPERIVDFGEHLKLAHLKALSKADILDDAQALSVKSQILSAARANPHDARLQKLARWLGSTAGSDFA
jgi:hypothetical protein